MTAAVTVQRCCAPAASTTTRTWATPRAITLLRDARQLQLRRPTSSATGPLRLGAADRHVRPAEGQARTTVYETDDEAYDIGPRTSACPPIVACASANKPGGRKFESDNSGRWPHRPCGPCSEIFYDHGPGVEAPPGPRTPRASLHRDLNLVFIAVQPRTRRHHASVAQALVWTRAGAWSASPPCCARALELRDRPLPVARQGRRSRDSCERLASPSLRVIADHIRACAFSSATA